jgi:hypothetical protein
MKSIGITLAAGLALAAGACTQDRYGPIPRRVTATTARDLITSRLAMATALHIAAMAITALQSPLRFLPVTFRRWRRRTATTE